MLRTLSLIILFLFDWSTLVMATSRNVPPIVNVAEYSAGTQIALVFTLGAANLTVSDFTATSITANLPPGTEEAKNHVHKDLHFVDNP